MDIVTHALIGSVAAAGTLEIHPAFSVGLVLGNVAPDLDAFSRVAGKQAFLRFHQTYTHSVGAIGLVVGLALTLIFVGEPVWAELVSGLAIGMAMHVGLDLTNSYGVRCLWPLSSKRFALDWIFFIDAMILAYTFIAAAIVALLINNQAALFWVSIIYVAGLAMMVAARGWLAKRARAFVCRSQVPTASVSIIPTTWSPRKFLICRDRGENALLSALDGFTGAELDEKILPVFDKSLPESVSQSREWTIMRELSSFYHAIEMDGETFVCRDLRIRNFDTRFGTLTVRVNDSGEVISKKWEV